MSKLRQYLADIASAIREKKGSSEPINAKDFSNEIRSIQSGAAPVVEEKDICFYDYDGTLLFSYTIAEAQALTELPTPKGHEGLVFQGWNWDYEDVIALDYPMDIGAMYITDDGATRLYINITSKYVADVPLYFSQSIENGVVIDWGDGTPSETYSGITDVNAIRHYNDVGKYCISLLPSDDCTLTLGVTNGNTNHNVFGLFKDVSNFGKYGLEHIQFGRNVINKNKSFSDCYSLETFSVPKGCVLSDNQFYGNIHLRCCVFPIGSILRSNFFQFCNQVCFPKELKAGNGKATVVAGTATSRYIRRLCIPDNVDTIGFNAARDIQVVYYRMPKSLNKIELYGTDGLLCLKVWDFRACQQVPVNAMTNKGNIQPDCKVVVPDALYEEWIAATNWAAVADQIIRASEYVEPQE